MKCSYCNSDLKKAEETEYYIWYQCLNEKCKVKFRIMKENK